MKQILIIIFTALSLYTQAQSVRAARQISGRTASLGFTGDTADVVTKTRGGVALVGGGGDVPGAFKWMIDRSGGGNVVVIRASGDYLYNSTIDSLGRVASVETLLINSREVANDPAVARVIR